MKTLSQFLSEARTSINENYEKTKAHLRSLGVPEHHCDKSDGDDGEWVHIRHDDAESHSPEIHKRVLADIRSKKLKHEVTDKGHLFQIRA